MVTTSILWPLTCCSWQMILCPWDSYSVSKIFKVTSFISQVVVWGGDGHGQRGGGEIKSCSFLQANSPPIWTVRVDFWEGGWRSRCSCWRLASYQINLSARYIVIYQSQLGCWHYEKLIYHINLCATYIRSTCVQIMMVNLEEDAVAEHGHLVEEKEHSHGYEDRFIKWTLLLKIFMWIGSLHWKESDIQEHYWTSFCQNVS